MFRIKVLHTVKQMTLSLAIPLAFRHVCLQSNKAERLMRGAPTGSIQLISDNGWMTTEQFSIWLDHFARSTGANPSRKIFTFVHYFGGVFIIVGYTASCAQFQLLAFQGGANALMLAYTHGPCNVLAFGRL